MDTLFINSEICKAVEAYRLLLDVTDKRNQKRSDKYFALLNRSMYYTWKIIIIIIIIKKQWIKNIGSNGEL